jgi:hypothetical protein
MENPGSKEKIPRLAEKSIKQSIVEYEAGNYKQFKTVKGLLHDIDSFTCKASHQECFFLSSKTHFVTMMMPAMGKLAMKAYGKIARNADGSNTGNHFLPA